MGVQGGEQGGIVAILFDELEVFVGNLNLVVWNLRRKLRWKNDFLLLLSHESVKFVQRGRTSGGLCLRTRVRRRRRRSGGNGRARRNCTRLVCLCNTTLSLTLMQIFFKTSIFSQLKNN